MLRSFSFFRCSWCGRIYTFGWTIRAFSYFSCVSNDTSHPVKKIRKSKSLKWKFLCHDYDKRCCEVCEVKCHQTKFVSSFENVFEQMSNIINKSELRRALLTVNKSKPMLMLNHRMKLKMRKKIFAKKINRNFSPFDLRRRGVTTSVFSIIFILFSFSLTDDVDEFMISSWDFSVRPQDSHTETRDINFFILPFSDIWDRCREMWNFKSSSSSLTSRRLLKTPTNFHPFTLKFSSRKCFSIVDVLHFSFLLYENSGFVGQWRCDDQLLLMILCDLWSSSSPPHLHMEPLKSEKISKIIRLYI